MLSISAGKQKAAIKKYRSFRVHTLYSNATMTQ